jgi:pentatricopeptide repeat protein
VEIFDKYASKQGSRQGSTAGNTGLTSSVFTTSNGVGTAGASQQSDLRGSQEAAQAGAKALVADEREEDGEGEVLPVDASVHCYSTLIQALGKIGNLQRAHEVLDGMVQNGPAPNIR